MKFKTTNKSAFTIVELLVIITVIGILAAISVVSYNGVMKDVVAATLSSDLSNAAPEFEKFYIKNKKYPATISTDCSATPTSTTNLCLKASNGNSYSVFPYVSAGESFSLTIAKGDQFYSITDGNPPVKGTGDWIRIGNQIWSKKNLNVGTMINGTVDQSNNSILEKYCYNNTESNCDTYGALYQWHEAMQYTTSNGAQGMCPIGSHIPTDSEWKTLEMYLGMSQAQADAINWRGTDQNTKLLEGGSSGFKALLTGYRNIDASRGFYDLGADTRIWTSTQFSASNAWIRYLVDGWTTVHRSDNNKTLGYSIRCIVDGTTPDSSSDWIQIGNQTWAKTNLNVGTSVAGINNQTNNSVIEKYCYNDLESNCTLYGGLYQWDEAMSYVTTDGAKGICPIGSHIPTDIELKTLESYLGMTQIEVDKFSAWRGTNEGSKMKVGGSSGFELLLAGQRFTDGSFNYLLTGADIWSSTESGASAFNRYIDSGHSTIFRYSHTKGHGFPIRCLKN